MITGVTSFNHTVWDQYGRDATASWAANWPGKLIAYYEDKPPPDMPKVFRGRDLFAQAQCREIVEWANKRNLFRGQMPNGEYNYHFNLWKFCRKVFAITDALKLSTGGVVYWLDADIVMKKPIPESFLKEQVEGVYTAYLGRKDYAHTETGLVVYDASHPDNERFWTQFRAMFADLTVLALAGWHDCWAYDYLIQNARPEFSSRNLTADSHGQDVFEQSPFHEYMTHWKGSGKKYRTVA